MRRSWESSRQQGKRGRASGSSWFYGVACDRTPPIAKFCEFSLSRSAARAPPVALVLPTQDGPRRGWDRPGGGNHAQSTRHRIPRSCTPLVPKGLAFVQTSSLNNSSARTGSADRGRSFVGRPPFCWSKNPQSNPRGVDYAGCAAARPLKRSQIAGSPGHRRAAFALGGILEVHHRLGTDWRRKWVQHTIPIRLLKRSEGSTDQIAVR